MSVDGKIFVSVFIESTTALQNAHNQRVVRSCATSNDIPESNVSVGHSLWRSSSLTANDLRKYHRAIQSLSDQTPASGISGRRNWDGV